MKPAPQSRCGTVRTDTRGRTWRKVERLERSAWLDALASSCFDARLGMVTDESFVRLGWRLDEQGRM